MLQVKCILVKGGENLNLYSEIINKVAREYKEFKNYKINNNLEGLLLDFDVNNKYRDFNLTFLCGEDNFKNDTTVKYSVLNFNNESQTDVNLVVDRYDNKHIRIQSFRDSEVVDVLTISQRDSLENIVYNLSDYEGAIIDPELKKTIKGLKIDNLVENILEYFGVRMGLLFSKTSKEILKCDIEKLFLSN
ncbi:MAG: hypothetical protein ACRC41_17445 [Sarcina sp.]